MTKVNLKFNKAKYIVNSSKDFDKSLRKIYKQGKNLEKLIYVVEKLANGDILDKKYVNHKLNDDKKYKDCYDCHIESDWILIYKYYNDKLILLLVDTGSHSNLF